MEVIILQVICGDDAERTQQFRFKAGEFFIFREFFKIIEQGLGHVLALDEYLADPIDMV